MRRILGHLLVATVTVVFVVLGFWQLSRHGQLLDRNARIEARLAEAPRPYQQLVQGLDPDALPGVEQDGRDRPVTISGVFHPEHEVLLRNRAYEERPGFHVLTPLEPTQALPNQPEGSWVLVNRGWIPFQYDDPNLPPWDAPEGEVQISGWLLPEADDPEGPLAMFAPRDPAEGALERVARPDVERLAAQMPAPLAPFLVTAGTLTTADGVSRSAATLGTDGWVVLPVLLETPQAEGGPHLSYALQWWSFALIAVIGYAFLLRRRDEPIATPS